jgi:hypothetical protein
VLFILLMLSKEVVSMEGLHLIAVSQRSRLGGFAAAAVRDVKHAPPLLFFEEEVEVMASPTFSLSRD